MPRPLRSPRTPRSPSLSDPYRDRDDETSRDRSHAISVPSLHGRCHECGREFQPFPGKRRQRDEHGRLWCHDCWRDR